MCFKTYEFLQKFQIFSFCTEYPIISNFISPELIFQTCFSCVLKLCSKKPKHQRYFLKKISSLSLNASYNDSLSKKSSSDNQMLSLELETRAVSVVHHPYTQKSRPTGAAIPFDESVKDEADETHRASRRDEATLHSSKDRTD